MRIIKALNQQVTAKTRLSIGLVGLVTSSLLLAMLLGLVPNERPGLLRGRARLSEAIAVYTSALVQSGDQIQVRAALEAIVQHNPEIASAAVRDLDGEVHFEIGPHQEHWRLSSGDRSTSTSVQVPIYSGANEKWGDVEIGYHPLPGDVSGWFGFLRQRRVQLVLFVGAACWLMFFYYLSRMLQHLDPSQAVPHRVRSALDTLSEGLLILDRKERIVLANRSFADIMGCSTDELLGQLASQFSWIHEDGSPFEAMPWQQALDEETPVANSLMNLPSADGENRTFIVNCSPVLGADGHYRGVLASFDDVTSLEQKKLELREASERAEAANRAKTEFLANMSHEIRTPMNAILGFADVLRRGYAASPEDQQQHLNTIHSSGMHLLDLINDILDLSKIESGKLQVEPMTVAIHDLIYELISVLAVNATDKGLSLSYHSDGPIPETIHSDPTRIRQIITNLVGNAIKFTDTGSVTVITRFLEASGPARPDGSERSLPISMHQAQSTRSQQTPRGGQPQLEIDVVDTGIGMQADVVERVFQPFAQADGSITRRFGGTGLGLAISRRFAEALGGSLTATSKSGEGSTFRLRIETGPVEGIARIDSMAAAAKRRFDAPVVANQPLDRLSGHILLVDDGESNRQLAQLVLSRAGLTVDSAVNGEEACAKATSTPYDAILMDMQMPVMDGYTATQSLRSRGFEKPIIALTGNAMKGEEEKCLAAGCSGFLSKPLDIDHLLQVVRDSLQPAQPTLPDAGRVPSPAPTSTASAEADRVDAGELDRPQRGAPSAEPATKIVSSLPLDDPDFREIVSCFVVRLREQLDAMRTSLESEDHEQLAQLAHWLKGAGGTVGFAAFTEPAASLEKHAKSRRSDAAANTLAELETMYQSIDIPDEQLAPTT